VAGWPKEGWPKGPFPEKWTFAAVERRLAGAWDEPARAAAWQALVASGATPLPPIDDLYVRPFTAGAERARAALVETGCTVFAHAAPGARVVPGALVALPAPDLFDALVALGVAGPHHGIGNRTIVRFLLQARPMASFRVLVAGEDLLELEMQATGPEHARLLAERLPHIAPTVARDGLEARLARGTRLCLDWSPPR
jgi:hypothetical protein